MSTGQYGQANRLPVLIPDRRETTWPHLACPLPTIRLSPSCLIRPGTGKIVPGGNG